MVSFFAGGVGNCNIRYVTGIRDYQVNKIELALMDMFLPKSAFHINTANNPEGRRLVVPQVAFLYFTHGSEDKKPYGKALAKKIKELGLGTVWASRKRPSPLHKNKPTIMFVWSVDLKAIRAWAEKKLQEIADNAKAEASAGNVPVKNDKQGAQQ